MPRQMAQILAARRPRLGGVTAVNISALVVAVFVEKVSWRWEKKLWVYYTYP